MKPTMKVSIGSHAVSKTAQKYRPGHLLVAADNMLSGDYRKFHLEVAAQQSSNEIWVGEHSPFKVDIHYIKLYHIQVDITKQTRSN